MGFVQVLKDLGYLIAKSRNEVFDYRFIEKVHPERPHYDIS